MLPFWIKLCPRKRKLLEEVTEKHYILRNAVKNIVRIISRRNETKAQLPF